MTRTELSDRQIIRFGYLAPAAILVVGLVLAFTVAPGAVVMVVASLFGFAFIGVAELVAWLVRAERPAYCDWEPGRLLIEPGISDVDHGRWARREFRCRHCGALRPMWQLVDTSTVLERCPSVELLAEREEAAS